MLLSLKQQIIFVCHLSFKNKLNTISDPSNITHSIYPLLFDILVVVDTIQIYWLLDKKNMSYIWNFHITATVSLLDIKG